MGLLPALHPLPPRPALLPPEVDQSKQERLTPTPPQLLPEAYLLVLASQSPLEIAQPRQVLRDFGCLESQEWPSLPFSQLDPLCPFLPHTSGHTGFDRATLDGPSPGLRAQLASVSCCTDPRGLQTKSP